MKIGIPKEIKNQEHRVAMVPASVQDLVKRGHEVYVQKSAGVGSSYSDEQFSSCGATLVDTAEEVFEAAELIVKVKEPQASEVAMLNEKHILFTYLHLAADKHLTETLAATGATCIAYETINVNGHLPLLEPMSEIAGRMSPGVLPGRVVVIGGGTAGINAARVAKGIGADVTILEVDFDRMRFLDITMEGTRTMYSTEANLSELLPRADLVIGAVLVPGAAAPKLINRDMLKLMQPGSVFVDIAVDQGGCAETTRATTHENPTYIEEEVVHYCVANMPGAYARTATQALNNVTHNWTALIAGGVKAAVDKRAELIGGINCMAGKVTCEPVAEAHKMSYVNPVDLL